MKICKKMKFFFFSFLIILFVQNKFSYAGLKVLNEIKRLEKTITELSDPTEIQKNKDYIYVLNLYSKKHGQSKSIREKYKNTLFSAVDFFKHREDSQVTLESVFSLTENIETNKKFWKHNLKEDPSTRVHRFFLEFSDGAKEGIDVEMDLQGRIYLNILNWGEINSGGFKSLEQVRTYETLEPITKLMPRKDGDLERRELAQEIFVQEGLFLKKLITLSKSKRIGLVDVISVSPSEIYEKYYGTDLLDYLNRYEHHIDKFTYMQRLQIMWQLSKGLLTLHEMGISHNDIKPDNVMLEFPFGPRGKIDAVYIDFGLSSLPKSLIKAHQLRSTGGTSYYCAPELISRRWPGVSEGAKKTNAFKSDIFSQTVLLIQMFNSSKVPWKDKCDDEDFGCKLNETYKYRDSVVDGYRYSSYEQLVLAGLHPEPMKRVSANQFHLGIEHLINKTRDNSKMIYFKTLEEVENKYKGLSHFRNWTPEHAVKNLKKEYLGSYYLVPIEVQSLTPDRAFAIALCFVNQDNTIEVKIFDFNPQDEKLLRSEISFLQDLGILRK